jgi:predicted RNase H-like nuclease (RuvC/YqgF family)
MDISLSSLKKNLDKKSKLFERYPRDPHVRGALFSTLKTYRKIRKSKIKEYHRKIIDLYCIIQFRIFFFIFNGF